MSDRPRGRLRGWMWLVAFGGGLVLALAAGYLLTSGQPPERTVAEPRNPPGIVPAEPPTPSSKTASKRPAEPTPQDLSASPPEPVPAHGYPVEPGATLELSSEDFPRGAPVVVSLKLGEPSATGDARPVRLIADPSGRVLEIDGFLDADRLHATIEVEGSWLEPGRYVVEVKTTERSHFPLRRYAIQVK